VLGPGTDGLDAIFLRRADEVGTHARAVRQEGAFSPVAEELTVRFRVTGFPDRPGGTTVVDVTGVHDTYGRLAFVAPSYQGANLATAVAAAEATLGHALHAAAAREALAALTIPGRFELVREQPPVIVDGSHNPQAAAVLADAVLEAFPDPAARPVVLLGVLADKDARGIVAALAPAVARFAVTQPESPRALKASALADTVAEVTGVEAALFTTLPEALGVLAVPGALSLLITGSITTAGQARRWLRDAMATGV